ncbi:MAG: hypothetical protein HQM04_05010 [Magnetococcales bacterium]|nr:hypothetical protein [Magnetococcales bacterium]MBF0114385.1 hypothetical protein [Magnetococcales bacterium]
MNDSASCQGSSLLELLIWITLIALAAAGMVPLFTQVLSQLHTPTQGMQAHFLAQAVIEQMNSIDATEGDLTRLPSGTCLQPDDSTPWADPAQPFSCQITLLAAAPQGAQNSMECTQQPWTAEYHYLCAIVTIQHRASQQPLAQLRALYAKAAPH